MSDAQRFVLVAAKESRDTLPEDGMKVGTLGAEEPAHRKRGAEEIRRGARVRLPRQTRFVPEHAAARTLWKEDRSLLILGAAGTAKSTTVAAF